jgi:hypothetical protein
MAVEKSKYTFSFSVVILAGVYMSHCNWDRHSKSAMHPFISKFSSMSCHGKYEVACDNALYFEKF